MLVKAYELKDLGVDDMHKFLDELGDVAELGNVNFYFCAGVASTLGIIAQSNEGEKFDELDAKRLLVNSLTNLLLDDVKEMMKLRLGVSDED